jgi:hypothetical protein
VKVQFLQQRASAGEAFAGRKGQTQPGRKP